MGWEDTLVSKGRCPEWDSLECLVVCQEAWEGCQVRCLVDREGCLVERVVCLEHLQEECRWVNMGCSQAIQEEQEE